MKWTLGARELRVIRYRAEQLKRALNLKVPPLWSSTLYIQASSYYLAGFIEFPHRLQSFKCAAPFLYIVDS